MTPDDSGRLQGQTLGLDGFSALLSTQQAVALAGGEVDAVMKAVVEGALKVMPQADGAVIEMRDGEEMVYRAASGTSAGTEGLRLNLRTSLSGMCVLKGEPLTCVDSEDDPRVDREACRRVGLRSMIVVPLPHRGSVVGAFKLYAAQPNAFTGEDMLAAQLLAGPIAIGLSGIAEAEAELGRARAEAAGEAKAAFLANMSHEIRTPMNGIIGFGDMLLRTELTAEQRRYASVIVESGGALLKLLNDILDFSKMEAGQLEVVDEPFDLPRALDQCGQLLSPSAQGKGLTLTVDLDPQLPAYVLGDALRLRQVVLNLLGNAVKFTAEGGVTLKGRLVRKRGADDMLLVSVTDTGIGIPPERLDSIFEKFVQADASVARRFGGTGLGLSISQRLAELMGGELELESALGRGTTVSLRLPLRHAQKPVDGRDAPKGVVAARPSHILMVEDIDINRELGEAMLKELGHSVSLAVDGSEAIRAFSQNPERFDLVLMDVNMPGIDGLEATRAIRAMGGRGVDVPIVALTASALPDEVARCLKAGMNDHVAKPITRGTLEAALNKWLKAEAEAGPTSAPPAPKPPTVGMEALAAKFKVRKADALGKLGPLAVLTALSDEQRAEIRTVSHQLAGISAIFGEPGLGDLARAVDELTHVDGVSDAALIAELRKLADALAPAEVEQA